MDEILNSQIDSLNIREFLNSAQDFTKEAFPDLNIIDLFNSSITGNLGNNEISLINYFGKIFSNELIIAVNLMASVLIVIIIHSIFKIIIESLENSTASQIVYMVQYLVIVTMIINTLVSILDITKNSINELVNFMNLLIPLLITLMLTTGSVVTTTMAQPILILMVSFIGNFINNFLIPLLLISIAISIVSNVSEKIEIGKISNFFKSSIVWILGIILTIFTCTLSIEGTLSSSVDGMTAKTAKAAVSNFIPVVGKIMGDTVETVIGCGNILKNSVGVLGVIVIIGIAVIPIIKITLLMISFKITSALCEVVADAKIVKLIDNVADSYKILLAILISVSIMFIVGITIVIKITNSSIMYR